MIRRGLLSDYFTGVAVKRLSVVETTPDRSNQHEFNGSRALRVILGDEDRVRIPAHFVWLGDQQEGITEEGAVSWYDSRKNQLHRSAEFRLYYYANAVSDLMNEGDTLFVTARPEGSVMVIVVPAGSTIQTQLLWLFGLTEQPELQFSGRVLQDGEAGLDFAVRYILDEIGIEPEEPEAERLDRLLEQFESKFPSTREFSAFARNSLPEIDARDNPDSVLMAWVEREDLLFRRLERRMIEERLRTGFSAADVADVEGFLAFSLSVQNRRKARAGQSLENHLEELFSTRGLRFARGAETENRNRPDFLFPGPAEYHDPDFPSHALLMLGAKSTCKERWRQVLSEAVRIDKKHLLTLEPGISENQTDEMEAKSLQLVVPMSLYSTYRPRQKEWLMSVNEFTRIVAERQAAT